MQDNFSDIKQRGLDPQPIDKEKTYPFINKIKGVTMYGVEETKEAAVGVAALVQASADSINDDGKIDLKDAPRFLVAIPKIITGITGSSEVPKEVGDMDPVEKEAVLAAVQEELNMSEGVEALVNQCLKIAYEFKVGVDLYKAIPKAA